MTASTNELSSHSYGHGLPAGFYGTNLRTNEGRGVYFPHSTTPSLHSSGLFLDTQLDYKRFTGPEIRSPYTTRPSPQDLHSVSSPISPDRPFYSNSRYSLSKQFTESSPIVQNQSSYPDPRDCEHPCYQAASALHPTHDSMSGTLASPTITSVKASSTSHSDRATPNSPTWPSVIPKESSNTVIACRQCRGRKIKCDSTRPICNGCLKRDYVCEYDPAPKRRGPDKCPGKRQRTRKRDLPDGDDASGPPVKKRRAPVISELRRSATTHSN
ncbi:hypothetical protein BDV98DRAFT_386371 [Pterulicium gracile]|uniref:Zn(2)-C6 fungal-type domain-containing protein n=1 Tax=Pterulicium gracile TaxID=1884261 RepID=A0A5C3QND7_9AGAR|nr:hypothetical protein BDV98DRAFT_386371 [Pterula gracilis]